MKKILILLFATLFSINAHYGQQSYWKHVKLNKPSKTDKFKNLEPKSHQTFSLDFNDFKEQFKNVTSRNQNKTKSNVIVSFPNEKGKFEQFRVYEAPVLTEELSKMYPMFKTYVGYSADGNGARIRFSVTPHGVQTMTSYLDKPTVFTVPAAKGAKDRYITYSRNARISSIKDFNCLTKDEYIPLNNLPLSSRDANDQTLRTFRIAISVNAEYTNFWDDGNAATGTPQEDALAQVISTLNRNNDVFENDMAITFVLVNGVQYNGSDLIFADATTDPYSGSYNSQLQTTLTSVVGEANYDIGHLFVYANSTDGSSGCIGCVCVDGQKGSGFSQHPFTDNDGGPYMTDFFDIDYVPHEIGHQMGANHTFSHNNEGEGVNAEPGSGSTIMGYAGIVDDSNVQNHSDAYFHYNSINQILNNIQTRTCWVGTTITNAAPVAEAGNNYVIPKGTAYVLKGAATDTDSSDILTFCWEQIDDGTITSSTFGPTSVSGSMLRSLYPSISTDRYVPKLSRVIANQLTEVNPITDGDWETVSTVARSLNFALTVRDRSEANGTGQMPQTSFDLMKITVDATGPFVVSSQDSNITWDAGSTETITWNVAGTSSGAVNTPTVNIKMSVDGGLSFPHLLASDVPNDGSQDITVPVTGSDTTMTRIMVEGNNNIFFAVNSINFSTQESEFVIGVTNTEVDVCSPNEAVYDFTYKRFLGFTGTTNFTTTGLPTGATVVINPTSASADDTLVTLTVSGIGAVAQGNYDFKIVGTSGTITKEADVILNVYSNSFNTITLTSPVDTSSNQILSPILTWQVDMNAVSYDVEVATDTSFNNIVASNNVTSAEHTVSLDAATEYFWRVKAKNTCGEGAYSTIWSFTTKTCNVCESNGNASFDTGTTLVKFNTIDNATLKENGGYSDFKSIITTVKKGDSHELTVNNDTDGDYTTHTFVWIDWNQNCSFDDAGEEYDLGEVNNKDNASTSLSPLTITIPTDAKIGSTVMRVSTEYDSNPTSCGTGYDGEVVDYTILVEDNVISVDDFAFQGFNLYPNPSNGEFTLNLQVVNRDKVAVQLFDIRGRLINEKNFFNTQVNFSERISFDKTAAGLYLVKITNGDKQTTRKLLIE